MRIIKIILVVAVTTLTSCASGYKMIQPQNIKYVSKNESKEVTLEYKYDLLDKKYAKKEGKKGIKLAAIKITNNSDSDLMFGREIKLAYENGNDVVVMENNKVFKSLKQSTASYLFYLLLTPLNFTTSSSSGSTSSTPIGLVIGPGIAVGNMIAAGSANKKFKTELFTFNLNGSLIKKGETKYGLIGIKSDSFDALKIKME